MLGRIAGRFADWRNVGGGLVPLLALGGVLAYARLRTASLWLPVGLHTGWLFARGMLGTLSEATGNLGTGEPVLSGVLLQQGLIPLIAIVLARVLTDFLTVNHDDESAISP